MKFASESTMHHFGQLVVHAAPLLAVTGQLLRDLQGKQATIVVEEGKIIATVAIVSRVGETRCLPQCQHLPAGSLSETGRHAETTTAA